MTAVRTARVRAFDGADENARSTAADAARRVASRCSRTN